MECQGYGHIARNCRVTHRRDVGSKIRERNSGVSTAQDQKQREKKIYSQTGERSVTAVLYYYKRAVVTFNVRYFETSGRTKERLKRPLANVV
jgi:hypothetical protein